VRIEKGFIGAHSDIGGGYGEDENQLSQVALSWMVAQAKQAGVKIQDAPPIDMNNPVLHDQSNAIQLGNPNNRGVLPLVDTEEIRTAEDRWVIYPDGRKTKQRRMTFNNSSLTNAATHEKMIEYTPRDINALRGSPELEQITGRVNMNEYMKWLRDNGYKFDGDPLEGAMP
jgi:hypothetical protein